MLELREGRIWLAIGALLGLTGVAMGAMGAHLLADVIVEGRADTFETAVRYQMYHALALMGVAYLQERWPGQLLRLTGWLFTAGVILFSGSLYVLALTDIGIMGAIAPLGGAAFISGWAILLLVALKGKLAD